MLNKLLTLAVVAAATFAVVTAPAMAIDEDAPALGFIPADSDMVIAVDMSVIYEYQDNLTGQWRDQDASHYEDAMRVISNIITRESGRPDVFTFYDNLYGVQAFTFNPMDESFLMVFTAEDVESTETLGRYTIGYILESRLNDAVEEIDSAISEYYYGEFETEEVDGQEYPNYMYSYPASLDDLIEFGYLEEFPINPYTGEPVRVVDCDEDAGLGDIVYCPTNESPWGSCCGSCCGESDCDEEEADSWDYYKLRSFHVGGIRESYAWNTSFEPYDDLSYELEKLERNYPDIESLGFGLEEVGSDAVLLTRDDTDTVFSICDNHILFTDDIDYLMEALNTWESGEGFTFSDPEDFDTSPAFMRSQMDLEDMMEHVDQAMEVALEDYFMDPTMTPIINELMSSVGYDALAMQHDMMWIEDHDIKYVRRLELTGDAEDTLIGSLMSAQPEELMMCGGMPYEIIGQIAWANPDDFAHAYIDFIFNEVIPYVMEYMGMEDMDDEMDIETMLAMIGLGDIQDMEFGDQLYIFLTEAVERENGMQLPGITAAMRTDNPDMAYVFVGLIDSMSFMIPEFPFYQADYDDENAVTWFLEAEGMPERFISPTVAWGDEWVVKSVWREDALAIIDALEHGYMMMPDGMEPANVRVMMNRRNLLRGIADVMYEIPEAGVPAIGGLLEVLAQLSDEDERMLMEVVAYDNYVETRCDFSVDLMENLVPVTLYIFKAVENEW